MSDMFMSPTCISWEDFYDFCVKLVLKSSEDILWVLEVRWRVPIEAARD